MEFTLFLTLVGICSCTTSWEIPSGDVLGDVNRELNEHWVVFKRTYNKSYSDIREEVKRRLYWEDNLRFIEEHNQKFFSGEETFSLGENQFADMSEEELSLPRLTVPDIPKISDNIRHIQPDTNSLESERVDWRERGYVTRVRKQGKCETSWVFSAVGALEGQVKKKTGVLEELSAQNIIDCVTLKRDKHGCMRGWPTSAYKYIKYNHGLDSEQCYPQAKRFQAEPCNFNSSCVKGTVTGYENVTRSEPFLQFAVSYIGPISVAIDGRGRRFTFYKKGIYNNKRCRKASPTTCMLAVGYGTDVRKKDYWIVKNSWGEDWGEDGYIKMARNKNNQCGIASYGSYPLV